MEKPQVTLDDVTVFVLGEAIGLPFCIGAGEAFVNGEYTKAAIGWGVGIPFCIAGIGYHFFKSKVPDLAPIARRWWPVGVLVAFAYVCGPQLVARTVRLTKPAVREQSPVPSVSVQNTDSVVRQNSDLKAQIAQLGANEQRLNQDDEDLRHKLAESERARTSQDNSVMPGIQPSPTATPYTYRGRYSLASAVSMVKQIEATLKKINRSPSTF